MKSEDKPKPIQIRLPKNLEDSLRHVAFIEKSTINSVMAECLNNALPVVSQFDLDSVDGSKRFYRTKEEITSEIDYWLDDYQRSIQLQLDSIFKMMGFLNSQVIHACSLRRELLEGDSTQALGVCDIEDITKHEKLIQNYRKIIAQSQYSISGKLKEIEELILLLNPETIEVK